MHTLSETLAWFSRILGCMFPKTSLTIIGYIGYRRVFLKTLGLDQVVCASDRAEILMPQSLQACNHDWSSSIHGDRWWNKRVWTSSWIKLKIIWEPRIWYSCWFYCCSTGLTVFLVQPKESFFDFTFTSTLLAEQGAQRSLMQRAQTSSDPFWALPSLSDVSISLDVSHCLTTLRPFRMEPKKWTQGWT